MVSSFISIIRKLGSSFRTCLIALEANQNTERIPLERVNKYGCNLQQNSLGNDLVKKMPTCSEKKSSVPHSNYCKNCEHDKGYNGYYQFNKDQFYEGEFFRDSTHGQGTYKWKNLAVYEGGFYSNFKEGYASLSFSDCSYFEGLFIKNQPFGPGILTHANGRQDAGFWMGKKLVRLSRAVDFVIPRLAPTSAAKIKLLQFRRLIPLNEDDSSSAINILKKYNCLVKHFSSPYSNFIYDLRSMFFDKEFFEKTYFINVKEFSKALMSSPTDWENLVRESWEYSETEVQEEEEEEPIKIPSHCLCTQDVFEMKYKDEESSHICERESTAGEYEMGILAYFTKYRTLEGLNTRIDDDKSDLDALNADVCIEEESEETTKDKSKPKIVSWNRSELCTEMLKQIFRYRAFEEKLNFNLAKLMLGARTAFRRTGEKEKQCVQFLKMCSVGPAHVVKDLLCSYEISEELMDARGNNSLMFAAATDQHDIIDVLLDYGVDVNTFNDESLTPLNLCLLRRLAQAYGIYNWETAFLPKEIDKTINDYDQAESFQNLQSIPSLDRIFGDGMSISDSKSLPLDTRFPTPLSSHSLHKNVNDSSISQSLEESKDISQISEITLCKISKSQGSYSLFLPSLYDRIQRIQKSSSKCIPQGSAELTRPLGSSDRTPKINIKIIPQSIKRDEFEKSVQKTSTDKYLFEISFEKKPVVNQGKESSGRASKTKSNRAKKEESNIVTEVVEDKKELDLELVEKIANIDQTITKLLKRGANPNISEVPKPSIHLGLYTKDIKTVYNLLLYGASPDSQLYSNVCNISESLPEEGLLTPLHVIVLQKPAQEYVEICELLLKFFANPEEETVADFFICEEEKDFLVAHQGRTPLQLLCMRPDLEYADPKDYLIKIALMLAKVSNKRHFYNGHSCLTLAMSSGNLKLLKALLESKYFDPNDVLEEDRGTTLHVLVSTELQKKTLYETSIKMCDMLIAGGANPLKKFKSPEKLLGTCIDYGYRQVEEEKEKRKPSTSGKKGEKASKEKLKKDKTGARDYLKDQERVIEYLGGIALDMAKGKVSKHSTGLGEKISNSRSQDTLKKGLETPLKLSRKEDDKSTKIAKTKEDSTENKQDVGGKEKTEKGEFSADGKQNKDKKGYIESHEGKNDKGLDGDKANKSPKAGKKEKGKVEEQNSKKNSEKTKHFEKHAEKGSKGKEKDHEKVNNKKNMEKGIQKTELNLGKQTKGSTRNLSLKHLGTHSETFPEKLRQSFLLKYGTCSNIDINEFLVPYVVLRNGELYYRFQGKTERKEQYSLI